MTEEAPGSMPPLARAVIEHRLPGRMRLRIAGKRGDAAFFRNAETRLAAAPGVSRVRASPLTGGILVEHGGDEEGLLGSARKEGLFAAALPPSGPSAVAWPVHREPSGWPLQLAALGLSGAGVLQLTRGRAIGSASENLWNAYGLYATTRQKLPAALLASVGVLQVVRGEVLGSAISLFLYAYSAYRMGRGQATGTAI
jgi:hypothetical protein